MAAKWNEHQTVLATAIYTPDRDAGPLEGTAAGSLSLGVVSNPRVRATLDCRGTNQVDTKEKTVVGNACGGQPGSHGSKAIPLSHA